jgi:diguanylate cyclase (GGDEF)-like protein/PAS domain S-box-containing protein
VHGPHGLPQLRAALRRCGHDQDQLAALGALATAELTRSWAGVLLLEAGELSVRATHDLDEQRAAVLAEALTTIELGGPDGPFETALRSGQPALLQLGHLAVSGPRPAWASELDRQGIAALGVTSLVAREHRLGLLVTARLAEQPALSTAELGEQARVAGQLAHALDNAAALAQMRQSGLVLDAMPDAIVGFSRDREVILWNHGAEQLYGFTEAEALGRKLDDLVTTDYGSAGGAQGSPAISLINKGSWTGRVTQRTSTGRVLHADVSIASVVADGMLRGAVSISRDVTSVVQAEQQRGEDQRRMQALLDASRAMTAVFDRSGVLLAVNAEWVRGMVARGLAAEAVGIGADYLGVMRAATAGADDARAILAGIEAVLTGRSEGFEWDHDVTMADGTVRAYMASVAPMPGAQGGGFATHTDITSRKVAERQLAHQATHDPMTGLRTRRGVEQALEPALRQATERGLAVGAIIADLDRFKDVNDTLGHEAGDQVLMQMAERLVSFEPASVIGRLAGDEFALILPEVRDRAELARLAGDLARRITAPLPLGDRELFFGVNIGTALSSDTDPGPDASANLLRAADTAMYRAKARGRNSIVAYDEGLRADVARRVQISTWLNRALERNEITVAYQPQFRCLDGRQVGVEALMRWHQPEAGDISPGEFVAIAEESGAIIPIGAWVLQEACLRAADWLRIAGSDFTVAVNLSPHQLIDPGLLDIVRSALLRSRLPATALMLEVTEGALIDDPEAATEALAKLRALGVRISLDDFGTGYSSLAYLAKFPVDELKVDRVFVRDIERDPRTRALAEGIVRIGHALGMRVLAEGVETPGQLRILTSAGCDCYQGFIAAAAESAERATERLRHRALGRDIPPEAALAAGRSISLT